MKFVQMDGEGLPAVLSVQFASIAAIIEAYGIEEETLQDSYVLWLEDAQNYDSYVSLNREGTHFLMSGEDLQRHINQFKCYDPAPLDLPQLDPQKYPSYVSYQGELYIADTAEPLLTALRIQLQQEGLAEIEILLTLNVNSKEATPDFKWEIYNTVSFIDFEMPYNLDRSLSANYMAKNLLPTYFYPFSTESLFKLGEMTIKELEAGSVIIRLKISDLITLIEAYIATQQVVKVD